MKDEKDKIIYVPVEDILPNRFQPRLAFDEKDLNELANSITKYGVIQPIVLRNIGDKYEIIAGERRYKASLLAGLKSIPAILNNADDNTSAEIALLENLQRKNLTPIEEAQSFKKLLDRGFTQEEIATKLGISQSAIANKIRLLSLPKKVQDALLFGRISERHARSLISLNNEDLQVNLLNKIISEKMTVKQTEEEVSLILGNLSAEKDIPIKIKEYLDAPEENKVIDSNENNALDKPSEQTVINTKENEELMRLLQPEPVKIQPKTEVDEYIEMKVPDVVSIEETPSNQEKIILKEDISNEEIINPFQTQNENTSNYTTEEFLTKLDSKRDIVEKKEIFTEQEPSYIKLSSEEMNNSYNTPPIDEQKEVLNENNYQDDSLVDDTGGVILPRVINKVRDFVSNLDIASNLITTSELDLTDKYQIIIEIEKDAL